MSSAAPLSMWELFLHADWIVKFVMVGLLITSVAVWGIAGAATAFGHLGQIDAVLGFWR